MSLTIWKYSLTPDCTIEMPIGANILCVQTQNNEPFIWAIVDPKKATMRKRKFITAGTGHDIRPDYGEYVGTFQLDKGAFVFHVFEVDP